MMEGSLVSTHPFVWKIVAPIVAAVAIAGGGIGYAVYQRHNAQTEADKNAQVTAQLNATQIQLDALAAKVNALESNNEAKPRRRKF